MRVGVALAVVAAVCVWGACGAAGETLTAVVADAGVGLRFVDVATGSVRDLATAGKPTGLALTMHAGFVFSDATQHVLYSLSLESGKVSTYAGGFAAAGAADGLPATARFNGPRGLVARQTTKELFVADAGNFLVRRINPAGVVTSVVGTTVAGSTDGKGTAAQLTNPRALTFGKDELTLYIADGASVRAFVLATQDVTTVAADAGSGSVLTSIVYSARSDGLFVAGPGLAAINSLSLTGTSVPLLGNVTGSNFGGGKGDFARFRAIQGMAIDITSSSTETSIYVSDSFTSPTTGKATVRVAALVATTVATIAGGDGTTARGAVDDALSPGGSGTAARLLDPRAVVITNELCGSFKTLDDSSPWIVSCTQSALGASVAQKMNVSQTELVLSEAITFADDVTITSSGTLALRAGATMTSATKLTVEGTLFLNGGVARLADFSIVEIGVIEFAFTSRQTTSVIATGSVRVGGTAVLRLAPGDEFLPGTDVVLFSWTGTLLPTSTAMKGWVNFVRARSRPAVRAALQNAAQLRITCSANTKACVATGLASNIANDDDDELNLIVAMVVIAAFLVAFATLAVIVAMRYYRAGYGTAATERLAELEKQRSRELYRRKKHADQQQVLVIPSTAQRTLSLNDNMSAAEAAPDDSSGPFISSSSSSGSSGSGSGSYSGSYS